MVALVKFYGQDALRINASEYEQTWDSSTKDLLSWENCDSMFFCFMEDVVGPDGGDV